MRLLTSTALALALSLGGAAVIAPSASHAYVSVGVSVGVAPPPLPVYEQPPIPGYGYIWTPGYWAWNDYGDDYYWVPGTWVLPPRVGFLWTPPWWGFVDGVYVFNAGYWGPEVGFYGGIDYGFGYTGFGYEGGYWRDGNFYYNRAVNNITNVNTTRVFDRPVSAGGASRVSFNGGARGVQARPTSAQLAAARGQHLGPTPAQRHHALVARADPALRASANHGAPPIAATPRPAALHSGAVVAAAGAASARAALSTARSHARIETHGAPQAGSRGAYHAASATHATQHRPPRRPQALAQSHRAPTHHVAYRMAAKHPSTHRQYAATHARSAAHQTPTHRVSYRMAAKHPSTHRQYAATHASSAEHRAPTRHASYRPATQHPDAHRQYAATAARVAPRSAIPRPQRLAYAPHPPAMARAAAPRGGGHPGPAPGAREQRHGG